MQTSDSILTAISSKVLCHVPVSNWEKIKVTFVVVSRFSQLGYYYLETSNEIWAYFPVNEYSGENAPINLFTNLRTLIAKENIDKGAWFSSQIVMVIREI
ncbi:MAG: hypothetical protein U0Y10_19795 [Spirosomataceae bacterium]